TSNLPGRCHPGAAPPFARADLEPHNMPRSEARIFTSIWEDDDFTILPPSAQRMYLFRVSQPDLSYCGVISLRERRWSKSARGMTVDEVRANLELLSQELHGGAAPMIVVDEDTEEVFVRSLIR